MSAIHYIILYYYYFNAILLAEAKAKITSLENANGWFERRLAESDSQAEAAKTETEDKLAQQREELEAKTKAALDEWQKVREGDLTRLGGSWGALVGLGWPWLAKDI